MRYANIYIYIFVLHRGFFQQPRGRVAPRLGPAPQLGRQFAVYQAITSQYFVFFYLFFTRLALSLYKIGCGSTIQMKVF